MKARNRPGKNRPESEDGAAEIVSPEPLRILAHELRTPLAAILYAIESLRVRGLDRPEDGAIERQVHHVFRLVEDLQMMDWLVGRGEVALAKERLPMRVVVEQALQAIGPAAEARGQQFAVDVPPELSVEADPLWMTQVVTNLFDNASKYSGAGSTITVIGRTRAGRVLLSVRDDGIGIAASMLERIFEPFVRAPQSASSARAGAGLGLAIVRDIVDMHDGNVRAHSAGIGRGSEFVVDLPAATSDGGSAELTLSSLSSAAPG